MSAIFGTVYRRGNAFRPAELSTLQRMGAVLTHRGKNGDAFFVRENLGMGACLWAETVFEEADSPIEYHFGEKTLIVLLDGEIYNSAELREELDDLGLELQTEEDTELLAFLYAEYGLERLLPRLRGKFAAAILDLSENALYFVRDPLGQKPLYYYQDDKKLLFASELKGILAHGDVKLEILPTAVEDYFIMGCVPGERSIYRHIRKMMHGSWMKFQLREDGSAEPLGPFRYWRFTPQTNEDVTEEEWLERIREQLEETISMMKGEVPGAGAFLSGGLDSSIVVAIQSRYGCEQIPTFSIGFQENAFNELNFAEAISDRFGTDMYEEIVEPDAVEELKNLVECYDEPYSDPSALPTLLVSRLAAHHVSIVFSGDGGDECFAGYTRQIHDMKEDMLRSLMPGFLRRMIFGPLGYIYPKMDFMPRIFRLKTAFRNLSMSAGDAYANSLSFCRDPMRQKLLAPLYRTPGFVPSDIGKQFSDAFALAGGRDTLLGMQMAEISVALPEAMVKVDRASMMCGLEVRSPFLDTKVLELAGQIPSEFKIREGLGKWILRKSFEPQFPMKLKSRPKQGFELPTDAWLRGPLKEIFREEVLGKNSRISQWVDINYAKKLYRDHAQGIGSYGGTLWSLLFLEKWAERWLD